MKPLPLPVRVAAGLAVTVVDQARQLPERLAELPVTVVSHALQFSMRMQQQVTELAIKGDDALSPLRPVDPMPEWVTFDEDSPDTGSGTGTQPKPNSALSRFDSVDLDEDPDEPAEVVRDTVADTVTGTVHDAVTDALTDVEDTVDSAAGMDDAASTGNHVVDSAERDGSTASTVGQDADPVDEAAGAVVTPPTAVPNYPALSLPQLRARLRRLNLDELERLLRYERAHADRPEFVGMLTRRITNVRTQL